MDIKVIAYGEVLLDQIIYLDDTTSIVPGGSPFNVAVALARQGIHAALVSPHNDETPLALPITAKLASSKVDTSLLVESGKPITVANAFVQADGSVEYGFLIDGTTQSDWGIVDIAKGPKDGDVLTASGSFALAIDSMAEVFDQLFEAGSKYHTMVFDPNVRTSLIKSESVAQERFDRWVSQATIVKASDEDVNWRYPDKSISEIGLLLNSQGPALVVITEGEKGVKLFLNGKEVGLPAIEIPEGEFVDAVGAGDTFNAGMIKWLIDNGKTERVEIESLSDLEVLSMALSASELAAEVCKVQGAEPPFKNEPPTISLV
jgi:fructokinase